MKKILAIIFSVILVLSLTACGGREILGGRETLEEFNTEATIEKTVIYDENNIKITANELTYDNFSANLSVTIENNSDKDLSFICGSMGYHVNSVNGYMIDDGYLNCDVGAGQSATDEISFDFKSLNAYGLTNIADIEIGFSIKDDDYKSTETKPLSIKTSIADSYDYSVNRYQNCISNGAFENRFDCKVNYFSDDDLYNNYNICITSAAIATNVDGEPALLLEIENNSSDEVVFSTKDVYINDCSVYDSRWSITNINANKKYIQDISLSDLVDEYEGDVSDVIKVSDISFTVSVGESWSKTADSKKINISVPEIKVPIEEE